MKDLSRAVQANASTVAPTPIPQPIISPATDASSSDQPATVDIHAAHDVLATRIRRAVRRHTNRAIVELRVEVDQNSVRLFGHCSSFYCKQLAQQAAMRMTAGAPLINDITVAE